MKNLFIPTLTIVTLFASCAKEPQVVEETTNVVKIAAKISNEITPEENTESKSDYDVSSGTSGVFCWSGVESISILTKNDGPNFVGNPFVSDEANSGETEIIFRGTPNANDMNYALYPASGSTNGMGWSSWDVPPYQAYRALRLMIPESRVYDSEHPLKNVVPMIGKREDANSEFVFKPVTAIIAVHVKNLPSTARSITLSSSGAALGGYYTVTSYPDDGGAESNLNTTWNNGLTVPMASNSSNTSGVSKYTFSSGLGKGQYDFYFPVSVGTLTNGLTITIKDGDESVLQTVSYSKPLTTVRAQITNLPLMDLAKATKVAIDGDAARFYAYLTALGPDAAKVKVAVAPTADAALTAAALSSKIITATGDENKVEVSNALSTSGKYYLAYKVYTSTDAELYSNTQPVFFVNSTDAAAIAGTFSRSVTEGEVFSGEANAPTTAQFKFIVSTDPTKGNIMMTAMDSYDPFTSNIPGVFKPDTEPSHALWLRFYNADLKKGFDTSKYLFNGSSPDSNDLIFVFTSDAKNTLYVGAGAYGVATTNIYPPIWHYVYNGNSGYPYAKQ